ncbi:hypothetical protein [Ensifer aridi]|uniref:hypothetical protein n=1 Tax=Ensifer aridi TaxID=1708715 RepID=UPI00358E33B7
MSNGKLVTKARTDSVLSSVFQEDIAWTRLEPQSISGDPSPGLEARVFDPLWLLAMQWRLGEFEGEDAGSPLTVRVKGTAHTVVGWQPGDGTGPVAAALPLPPGQPLDPHIERETYDARALGVRQRAEAGADLVEQFRFAGVDPAGLVAACRFTDGGSVRSSLPPALRLAYDMMPDGLRAAEALEAAMPGRPDWLAGTPQDLQDAVAGWLQWFRNNIAPKVEPANDCWTPDRLEYRFSLEAGAPGQSSVLRAPLHAGGEIDWYSFDLDEAATLGSNPVGAQSDSSTFERKVFATSLRYAGMPSNRYWQCEDGGVNFGLVDAQTHDLARLCLTEFALVYGNDWLVVPVDTVPASLCKIDDVRFDDSFGVEHEVRPTDDAFRLFHLASPSGPVPALLTPPSALDILEGVALEEVRFVRDEVANLVWAIEAAVQAVSGDRQLRGSEPWTPVAPRPEGAAAELEYVFMSEVPPNWIPFVPVQDQKGAFYLRKGRLTEDEVNPAKGILISRTPYDIMDEEVPREGIRVVRVPSLARAADGSYLRWISRRVESGRGEAFSGLANDFVLKTKKAAE